MSESPIEVAPVNLASLLVVGEPVVVTVPVPAAATVITSPELFTARLATAVPEKDPTLV